MSKKCGDHKLSCELESSRNSYGLSTKRKRSRCHKKSSRDCESSSGSREKSKRTRKVRIEHSEFDNTETESGTCRLKSKHSRKAHRKRVKSEKRRKRKKKKKTDSKKRKLSGSWTCSRLIEFLIKSCSCLKSLDSSSSSSSSPSYDVTSCCCRCKCRFCRPDCDSKSIQCDDCDRLVSESRREIHNDADNLRDSGKKGGTDLTNRDIRKPMECVISDKSRTHDMKWNDFQSDLPEVEVEETPNSCTCDGKKESDSGIRSSIVKSLTALKDFRNRRISAKSLIDEKLIISNDHSVKSLKNSCNQRESPKLISPPKKIESTKQNAKNCSPCRVDDHDKSSKALLIMFDIVFWPHTCFPKRRYSDNKNKKK